MSSYVSVIFCKNCGSRYVEISEWSSEGKGIVMCRSCGNKEEMGKFTMGRCAVSNSEIQDARDTRAKKGRYER